jgi:hypothetical protein
VLSTQEAADIAVRSHAELPEDHGNKGGDYQAIRFIRLKRAAWNAFISGLSRRREQRVDLLDRNVGDLKMLPIEIE